MLTGHSVIAFSPVRRLRALWPLKLALTVLLTACVLGPYLFLQRHTFFAAREVYPGRLDSLIPFSDDAVWLYLSLYLLMPIAPLLMVELDELRRYATGMLTLSLTGDFIFLFWPTFCARPAAAGTNFLYQRLVAFDSPGNAFPSLHAAFAVFSVLCCDRVLAASGDRGRPPRAFAPGGRRALLYGWTAAILYSILATRQHVFADLLAGAGMGVAAYLATFGGGFTQP